MSKQDVINKLEAISAAQSLIIEFLKSPESDRDIAVFNTWLAEKAGKVENSSE